MIKEAAVIGYLALVELQCFPAVLAISVNTRAKSK
jgi:hypothetical protein